MGKRWNSITVIARNDSVEIINLRVDIPFFYQSQVQLAINATTPEDAGNYTFLVINDVGNSSETTSVVIQGVIPFSLLMMLVTHQRQHQLLFKVCFPGVLY